MATLQVKVAQYKFLSYSLTSIIFFGARQWQDLLDMKHFGIE